MFEHLFKSHIIIRISVNNQATQSIRRLPSGLSPPKLGIINSSPLSLQTWRLIKSSEPLGIV